MWIIVSVILGLIVLILLVDNSLLRKENEALKYTNIYLSFKFKFDSIQSTKTIYAILFHNFNFFISR
ncbi:DUF1514 family protein [Staphylococcus intermedius]|uniref:DUF1514 family protein n=1 Tax=Staphylococcus intermedius TaxID=1285 RepID=UPI000BBBF5B4|nr:DUF1514 family protein [Staphylococcus intermedius]PCF86382.1 hypothetical protein B4W75_10530 [Staphylococcus intermedius]